MLSECMEYLQETQDRMWEKEEDDEIPRHLSAAIVSHHTECCRLASISEEHYVDRLPEPKKVKLGGWLIPYELRHFKANEPPKKNERFLVEERVVHY